MINKQITHSFSSMLDKPILSLDISVSGRLWYKYINMKNDCKEIGINHALFCPNITHS